MTEALTGVLTGVLTEVLTGVLTEVWPEGVDGCCGGGSDGCFDGIVDGGFDSGSFLPSGRNLAKTGLFGRFRPWGTTLRKRLFGAVETDRSLPVDDQPAIVSEAKIPPPGHPNQLDYSGYCQLAFTPQLELPPGDKGKVWPGV